VETVGTQTWRTLSHRPAMGAVLLTTWMAWGFGSHTISGIDPQNSTRELVAFHLSMAKLSKAAQASKTLEKLSETDPSLKGVAQLQKQKGPQSIAEAVARIHDHPQARTAIEGAGLSTRDYVLTMYCLEQSTQALFLKQAAGEKPYPPGASKNNIIFVRNHLKEINRLFNDRP
jgi:hypothetical protein